MSSMRKRLGSAIRDKACPICLRHIHCSTDAAVLSVCMHVYCTDCIRKWSQLNRTCPLCKSHFHSWFIKSASNSYQFQFHEEQLPSLDDSVCKLQSQFHDEAARRSSGRRSHIAGLTSTSLQRGDPQLPWRRSFRFIPYDHHTLLRWRASIYSRRLRAVPLPSKNCLEQKILTSTSVKERIKQRIEPWITRELQAILQDPDPTVIVHVATSLYMSSLEEKLKSSSRHSVEATFVEQLRPFLQDQTNMFWHELRCFAGSSFNMAAYDSLVEYKSL